MDTGDHLIADGGEGEALDAIAAPDQAAPPPPYRLAAGAAVTIGATNLAASFSIDIPRGVVTVVGIALALALVYLFLVRPNLRAMTPGAAAVAIAAGMMPLGA